MKEMKGKTAFVTGAAGGIGFGIATAFARAGMNVAIADIQTEKLSSAARLLKEITPNILSVEVDSTDKASMAKAAKAVDDEFGHLHVLCNNAGIGGGGRILDTKEEQWRRVFEVNFWGPLNGINAFLPAMLDHGEKGHIINTASFSGIHGHGHQSAYGSSKFALVGMSEFLRNDLKGTNIDVSVLCPHVVDTPIFDGLRETASKEVIKMIEDLMVPAGTVGEQVLEAIKTGEFYIFCDGTHTRGMLEERCNDLTSAMNRQFPGSSQ